MDNAGAAHRLCEHLRPEPPPCCCCCCCRSAPAPALQVAIERDIFVALDASAIAIYPLQAGPLVPDFSSPPLASVPASTFQVGVYATDVPILQLAIYPEAYRGPGGKTTICMLRSDLEIQCIALDTSAIPGLPVTGAGYRNVTSLIVVDTLFCTSHPCTTKNGPYQDVSVCSAWCRRDRVSNMIAAGPPPAAATDLRAAATGVRMPCWRCPLPVQVTTLLPFPRGGLFPWTEMNPLANRYTYATQVRRLLTFPTASQLSCVPHCAH